MFFLFLSYLVKRVLGNKINPDLLRLYRNFMTNLFLVYLIGILFFFVILIVGRGELLFVQEVVFVVTGCQVCTCLVDFVIIILSHNEICKLRYLEKICVNEDLIQQKIKLFNKAGGYRNTRKLKSLVNFIILKYKFIEGPQIPSIKKYSLVQNFVLSEYILLCVCKCLKEYFKFDLQTCVSFFVIFQIYGAGYFQVVVLVNAILIYLASKYLNQLKGNNFEINSDAEFARQLQLIEV